MRLLKTWLPLLVLGAVFVSRSEARRVRIQQPYQQEEEQETVNYYAAEPQEDEGQQVVLVSSADRYNGLYGQQAASPRSQSQNNYISRGLPKAQPEPARQKESPKTPPVQTLRNYNKVNDDGSFTFGYEAADGSFKEETRGTDCVVRGKYGYVDPDGNKREFTYVSGNPCDPNAPKDQEDEPSEESNDTENDNAPANYPTRPIVRRPIPTQAPKPAVTLFQNNYAQEEEEPEPEQLLRATPQPIRRPQYVSRPQYVQPTEQAIQIYQRPQIVPSSTPSSLIYKSSIHPVNITPRPVAPTASARTQLPATTYRPQALQQVSVTPRPQLYYSKQALLPSSTASPSRGPADFDSEFQKFQQENNIVSPTPSYLAAKSTTARPKATPSATPVYSTALVYDPATGQYNNQLYQSLPQTDGDFLLKQRIQPYVQQQQRPQVLNIQQLQQRSPLYSQNLRPQPIQSQAAYQAQQAELQFQNSAQLYAQQQRARSQQEQQRAAASGRQAQQVYYVQPQAVDSTGALATSQIDAFLRGHNIQF